MDINVRFGELFIKDRSRTLALAGSYILIHLASTNNVIALTMKQAEKSRSCAILAPESIAQNISHGE